VSDRRYSTSAWQKTREAILQQDGYVCRIRGPRCTGHATSVHHIIPSSQRPDFFWDSDNLAAACQACNSGGGRRVGLENQRTNLLQIAGAIEQLGQRLYAVSERITQLEQANGNAQPDHAIGHPQPSAYPEPARPEPRIY